MSLAFKTNANFSREICLIKHPFMFYCCKNKLFTACFGNIYNASMMSKLYSFRLISMILLLRNNSFRILNNLPMGCSVRHTFTIGNVISGIGII